MRVNPKRRKLRATKPTRTLIDRAEHLEALLQAAGTLDAGARQRKGQRRALVATLAFAGLRIGELCSLRWRDVDLPRGTITVRSSKTEAGERVIDVLPVLRDELLAYRATMPSVDRERLVFATSTGGRPQATNVRKRIITPAVALANAKLRADDREPMPESLTPHSLRRTFASILVAIGADPAHVMAQMGHSDAVMTLGVYAREMRRRDGEHARLRALVGHEEWARMGTTAPEGSSAATQSAAA